MQLFLFLFPLERIKRPALQNKQVVVLRMAFRARKGLGPFEKRAPGLDNISLSRYFQQPLLSMVHNRSLVFRPIKGNFPCFPLVRPKEDLPSSLNVCKQRHITNCQFSHIFRHSAKVLDKYRKGSNVPPD